VVVTFAIRCASCVITLQASTMPVRQRGRTM
jgi:hypothetical protein